MNLKVYWTEVETLAGGEVYSSTRQHSWAPIAGGDDCGADGLRRRWEASGQRWAAIEVDWCGEGLLHEALGPHEVLSAATRGVPGFRMVGAGIGSGVSAARPRSPEPRLADVGAACRDAQGSFGWDTRGGGLASCRTSSRF